MNNKKLKLSIVTSIIKLCDDNLYEIFLFCDFDILLKLRLMCKRYLRIINAFVFPCIFRRLHYSYQIMLLAPLFKRQSETHGEYLQKLCSECKLYGRCMVCKTKYCNECTDDLFECICNNLICYKGEFE